MTISIGRNNPVRIRLVLEALSSKPRLNIIKLLIEKGRLTASEISQLTNTSLSTIMEHLELLQAAGLIRWTLTKRGRRKVKLYQLTAKYIDLKIDLNTLVEVTDISSIREQLKRYIELKTEQDKLPLKTNLNDITKTLNLKNMMKAIAILDMFNYDEEYIVGILAEKIKNYKLPETIEINELAQKMNIHEYWALRLAQRLGETDEYMLTGKTLHKVSKE